MNYLKQWKARIWLTTFTMHEFLWFWMCYILLLECSFLPWVIFYFLCGFMYISPLHSKYLAPSRILVFRLKLSVLRRSCLVMSRLVHPGVRDKRRVSEIDLSQPRHETAFWWRHNGPVTSQLTDPIKWPNYPLELIGIYKHVNIRSKESLAQRCRRSTNVQLCLILLYISIWFES